MKVVPLLLLLLLPLAGSRRLPRPQGSVFRLLDDVGVGSGLGGSGLGGSSLGGRLLRGFSLPGGAAGAAFTFDLFAIGAGLVAMSNRMTLDLAPVAHNEKR